MLQRTNNVTWHIVASSLHSHVINKLLNQVRYFHIVRLPVVIQQQAMHERLEHEIPDVLRRNMRPPFGQSTDASGADQRLATARTRAPFYVAFDTLGRYLRVRMRR